ncbi:LysR substrate-binding domain-containing protein [Plesiomonas shigelloides]|uniref:LysR family transcriptional regulator n=1 Tax=Plesiomonas shigelloides 302-73 TaxID=1315976 RepID=R8AVJ9_PLESH|nr:LysR substrate-binding domain-containing protein [Plesiomonas shigelloides]EON90367.1 LysR family transcriptional regulator [Plesiomonas shigelloides 302-73]
MSAEHLPNIETKWLHDFLVLAEKRNFSAAAALRNVTQPAFSRRIRALEQALNTELVNRDTHPLTLTASGKQFHATARSLLNQMEEEIGRLAGLSLLGGQTVRIAAAHSLATHLLPYIQPKLAAEHPNVTLNVEAVDADDAVETLREGACDILLAFAADHLSSAPYQSLCLGRSHLHLVCRQPAPWSSPINTAPEDDDKSELPASPMPIPMPWLAYSPSSYMARAIAPVQRHVELQPVFSSSMSDLIKQLVLQGAGVAWLPQYALHQEQRQGQLQVLHPTHCSVPLWLYAYRFESRLHPAGEKVWQGLARLAQDPEFSALL